MKLHGRTAIDVEMDAKKFNLGDMMRKIKDGELQLPDFQRSWIWDDDRIISLLESVIRGFPINSIMLLECDAGNVKFSYRPIELLTAAAAQPQQLILDGQQRLTSLYGALYSVEPVKIFKGKKTECLYYVDMAKAISAANGADVEDWIISVPPSRKLKAKGINWDLSAPEKEFAAGMFPLNKIFSDSLLNWIFAYNAYYAGNTDKISLVMEFNNLISKISRYEIIAVVLAKGTPLEAICNIFERVNKQGSPLDVFDLLTAVFAAKTDSNGKPIELRKDWDAVQTDFKDSNIAALVEVDCSDFITALALLVSYEHFRAGKITQVSCKGGDILKLDYGDYLKHKGDIIGGFAEAGKFLEAEGITTTKYLPYRSQLVPMAAIFAELKLSGKDNVASRNKIRQWYWCAVFSESYKDGQGARYAKDITQFMDWIDKRKEPEILRKANIVAKRLLTVRSGTSAAYKGMISLILKNGARDFLAGKNMGTSANFAESIEIHHIFPKKYCVERGLPKDKFDSIANKTLILKDTNRIIGSNPPSVYLQKIERKTGLPSAEVDEILERHFIDAELCRADNFDEFVADRARKIFAEIEQLTGHKVIGEPFK